MNKYIDAEALIAQIRTNVVKAAATERGATDPVYMVYLNATLNLMTQEIDEAPAADVKVAQHGHWIEDAYGFNRCSECAYEWDESEYKTPFCPECGANMETEAALEEEEE